MTLLSGPAIFETFPKLNLQSAPTDYKVIADRVRQCSLELVKSPLARDVQLDNQCANNLAIA